MARPNKVDWEAPETLKTVRKLAGLGLTQEHIAKFYEVAPETIRRNKRAYKKFCAAIEKGKIEAVVSVSSALFQAAMKGNVTAQFGFLQRRAPELWPVERVNVTHTGEMNINVESKQELLSRIASLAQRAATLRNIENNN